jgi:hypothetical protein
METELILKKLDYIKVNLDYLEKLHNEFKSEKQKKFEK